MKKTLSSTSKSAPDRGAKSALPVELPEARRLRRRRAALIGLILIACLAPLFVSAWRQSQLREAYLPDLRGEARRSPNDAQVQVVLGGRLAQTLDGPDEAEAADTLEQAIKLGAHDEAVYLTLAWVRERLRQPDRAMSALTDGESAQHGPAPTLSAAVDRLGAVGQADPDALATAVSPNGADPLLDEYASGGFLNAYVSSWGHLFPERSGFATREQWAAAEPSNVDVQRLWGLALLQNHRVPEAIAQLRRTNGLAPNSAPVLIALAQAYEADSQFDLAKTQYLAALAIDSRSLPALLGFGRVCLEEKIQYARPAFLSATKLYPDSVEAWIGLGKADLGVFAYWGEAERSFDKVAQLAPDRTDYFDYYANALINNVKWDDAERLCRRNISKNPNDATAHYQLGHVLYSNNPTTERLTEAESETRQSIGLVPGAPMAYEQLGAILVSEGKARDAIDPLERSVSIEPSTVAAYSLLAHAYAQVGDEAKADAENARAATMFADNQKIDTLLNDANERFTDVRFHRDLCDAYRQFGRVEAANQEQGIVDSIQKDPEGFRARYSAYMNSIQQVFHDTSTSK